MNITQPEVTRYQQVMAFMDGEFLGPPKHHFNSAVHYWIARYDYDGRHANTFILQWQPNAMSWCHSDRIATGQAINLTKKDHVLIAPVAEPDIENDKEYLKDAQRLSNRLLGKMQRGEAFTEDDLKIIKETLLYVGGPVF